MTGVQTCALPIYPAIAVAVRTHSAAEQAYFEEYLATPGIAGRAVYSEREAALSMAHYALLTLGSAPEEADQVIASLRGLPTEATETFNSLSTQEYQSLARMARASGAANIDARRTDS